MPDREDGEKGEVLEGEARTPPNWDVDDALLETIDAIDAGAPFLPLSASARADLDDFYRPNYQACYDEGLEWDDSKDTILVLAHLVGAFATPLEIAATFPDLPVEISSPSALSAAEAVAHIKLCPDGIKILGSFCTNREPLEREPAVIQGLVATFKPLLPRDLSR